MKRLLLMVLVAMWGLVSCGWLGEDVDVAAGVILRYNNETEHLIQIKDDILKRCSIN